MLSDLSNKELEEKKFQLSKLISESKSKREQLVKDNLFKLLNHNLKYIEVHYFNNVYNFYELEKQKMIIYCLFLSFYKCYTNTK